MGLNRQPQAPPLALGPLPAERMCAPKPQTAGCTASLVSPSPLQSWHADITPALQRLSLNKHSQDTLGSALEAVCPRLGSLP